MERGKKYKVYMRKYDIGHRMDKQMLSQIAGFQIDGIWHTSIEIHDREYFMGSGIEECEPGTCKRYGLMVDRVFIGETDCDPTTLREFIEDHKDSMWSPETYNLLEHNCNHFSDYMSNFLVGEGIPADILELAEKAKKNPMFLQLYSANQKGFHAMINENKGDEEDSE